MKLFSELNSNSRVWVYQSSRNLKESESSEIRLLAAAFVNNWTSHGNDLLAASDVQFNRFLIFAVDENASLASGCSIDKSVAFVKDLEIHFKIDFMDRTQVAYLTKDEVVDTFDFRQTTDMILNEAITPNTLIFNNTITTLSALKDNWIVELRNSWLSKFIPQTV